MYVSYKFQKEWQSTFLTYQLLILTEVYLPRGSSSYTYENLKLLEWNEQFTDKNRQIKYHYENNTFA